MGIGVGDIVFCQFPMEEGGALPHFCIVIELEETMTDCRLRLAFGSSRAVSVSGHLDWEFVVTTESEIRESGLHCPTRFDLKKTVWKSCKACYRKGSLPKGLYREFRRAAICAGLI